MRRIRVALGSLRSAATAPFARLWDWWSGIPDEGQVAVVGLVLLGAGAALVWPPAGLIAPGVAMTAIGMGFRVIDRFVSVALVIVGGLTVIAAIVVGGSS